MVFGNFPRSESLATSCSIHLLIEEKITAGDVNMIASVSIRSHSSEVTFVFNNRKFLQFGNLYEARKCS